MKPKAKRITGWVFSSLLLFVFSVPLNAQETSYDRYGALLNPPSTSKAKNIAQHFLVYPFEVVRWPVDKTLVYVEKHYIDKKVQWIYDTIEDQGITPHANVISLARLGGGVDVDFVRLLRQKEHLPDAIIQSWFHWTNNVNLEAGTRVGLERIGGTNFRSTGLFKYESHPEEHFYGIGPNTSAGDGTSYKMEQTTLEPSFGYRLDPTLEADFKFAYRNINITEGEDEGRGIIDKIFDPHPIPGIRGDELLSFTVEAKHDTRNRKENSTKGGLRRVSFGFHEGLEDSEARYFKYEIEASQFIRLLSDRRILAVHFYGETNDELDKYNVPFHQMAKLGGFGARPRMSHTLRGYDFNRFFDESALLLNVEYRYTIWEYRDFKLDTILSWDEGQVFGEFSELQMKDFRYSFGGGFRLSLANHIIFAIEISHADEGTNFYARTRAPF